MKENLLWNKVLKRIKEETNSLSYATWFAPTKLKIIDENKLVILVPTEIHQKHLSSFYFDIIVKNLLLEIDEIKSISFVIETDDKENLEYVARHAHNDFIMEI